MRSAVLLTVLLLALVGCSSGSEEASGQGIPEGGTLHLAHTSHDEDVALANLTAVVMESLVGYDVTLTETTPAGAIDGVAAGDYAAYQGVWEGGQDALLARNEGDLNILQAWLVGKTRASLAAPAYMGVFRLDEAREAGAEQAFVLEDDAFPLGGVPEAVFEEHGLTPNYYPDMAALWDAAGPLYENEEPFVVFAYAPNWTNLEYDLSYLEGEELLREFNEPHSLSSVGRPGFGFDDPFAYAMLDDLRLTESQLATLELEVQRAETPRAGAVAWADDNASLMASWVYTARQRAG